MEREKLDFVVKEDLCVMAEYPFGSKKLARVMKWGKGEWGLDLRTWYQKEGSEDWLPGKGVFLSWSQVQVLKNEKVLERAEELLES